MTTTEEQTPNRLQVIVRNARDRCAPMLTAVDKGTDVESFMLGVNAALAKSPDLAHAAERNPSAFFVAIARAAQLGLCPDPSLGHFDLIAYKDEIDPQIGYRGYMFLAEQSGCVEEIGSMVIYRHEAEECCIERKLPIECPETGRININSSLRVLADPKLMTDDKIVAAAAWVKVIGRDKLVTDVMRRDEIEKRRAAGKGKQPAWAQWYAEQCQKTVIKRLLKRGRVPMGAHHRRIMAALREEPISFPEAEVIKPAQVSASVVRPQPTKPIEARDYDRRDADPLPSDDDRRAELTADIWEMADRAGIDTEAVHAWSAERHGSDIETATLDALADVRRALDAGEIASEPAAVAKVRGMFGEEGDS